MFLLFRSFIFLFIILNYLGCNDYNNITLYLFDSDISFSSKIKIKKQKLQISHLKMSDKIVNIYWNGKYLNGIYSFAYDNFKGGNVELITDKKVVLKDILLENKRIDFIKKYKDNYLYVYIKIPSKNGKININFTLEPTITIKKYKKLTYLFDAKPFLSQKRELSENLKFKIKINKNWKYISSNQENYVFDKNIITTSRVWSYLEFAITNDNPAIFKPTNKQIIEVYGEISDFIKNKVEKISQFESKRNTQNQLQKINIFVSKTYKSIFTKQSNYIISSDKTSKDLIENYAHRLVPWVVNIYIRKALILFVSELIKKEKNKNNEALIRFLFKHKQRYINLLHKQIEKEKHINSDIILNSDILLHKYILLFSNLFSWNKLRFPELKDFEILFNKHLIVNFKKLKIQQLPKFWNILFNSHTIIKVRLSSLKKLKSGVTIKLKNIGDAVWSVPYTYLTDQQTYSGWFILPLPGQTKEYFISSKGNPKDLNIDPQNINLILPLDWH